MSAQVNERDLIDRIHGGDRLAFTELVRQYAPKGFTICYRFVENTEDAKDVLQEAFIKVYKHIGSFRKESSFSTWFYRIVVNTCNDFFRRKKRVQAEPLSVSAADESFEREVPDTAVLADARLEENELREVLNKHIEALPDKQRTAFILRYRQGLSGKEISQVMRCNVATAKVYIFRAVRALQKTMASYIR